MEDLRLTKLKDAFENGILTEEEYNKKREAIVNELTSDVQKKLNEMHELGILTDEELEQKKKAFVESNSTVSSNADYQGNNNAHVNSLHEISSRETAPKKDPQNKKIVLIVAALVLVIAIALIAVITNNKGENDADTAYSDSESENIDSMDEFANNEDPSIKTSPDKYTWYVRNYVGRNVASIGYTSMGGDKRDEYGDGNVLLTFITPDGSYMDPEDEDQQSQYVVVAQDLKPNTEIKYTFEKDEDGKEYDNLVATSNVDEIVLLVEKVSDRNPQKKVKEKLTEIKPAADKYTHYVADYVGRNLYSAGYISMGGDLRGEYGEGNVKLDITTDDGTYIDPEDEELLKQYYVVSQSIEPNTEIKMTFEKDENGEEYDGLVASQSIDSIELKVKKIDQQ